MISTPDFHPFLSHFPTALFIAGCLLLFWGKRKESSQMMGAASLNLSMALLAAILSALSGMFAADLEMRSTTEVEGHQGYSFAFILLLGISTAFSYTSRFSNGALWSYFFTLLFMGATAFSGYLLVFHSTG